MTDVQNAVFHPALPLLLAALFASYIGLAAAVIWLRRNARGRMTLAPFVVCWLAWSGVIASFSIDLYGAGPSVFMAAIAVGAGLVTVYVVAMLGERRSSTEALGSLRTALKALVAGLLGTAVVPVLLLMLAVTLGIDGP
jgi:hypothetical protein